MNSPLMFLVPPLIFFFIILISLVSFAFYMIILKDYLYVKNSKYKWEYKTEIYKQKLRNRYESIRPSGEGEWRFFYYKYSSGIFLDAYLNNRLILQKNKIWNNCFHIDCNMIKRVADQNVNNIINLYEMKGEL